MGLLADFWGFDCVLFNLDGVFVCVVNFLSTTFGLIYGFKEIVGFYKVIVFLLILRPFVVVVDLGVWSMKPSEVGTDYDYARLL